MPEEIENITETKSTKLFNKDIILILCYCAQGNFGAAIFGVALAFLVLKLTSSPSKMAVTMALSTLPNMIKPFTSVFFDRISIKLPVVFLNFLSGINIIFLFLYLFYFFHSTSNIYIIYCSVFIDSLAIAIYEPTYPKIISYIILPKFLERVMGILSTGNSLTQMCGTMVGGFLVSIFGPTLVVFFYGINEILVTIYLIFVKMPKKIPKLEKIRNYFGKDLLAGAKIIWHNNTILFLVFTAFLIDALMAPLSVLLPIYMNKIGKGSVGFSLTITLYSAGLVLGSLLVAGIGNALSDIKGLSYGFIGLVVAFFGLALFKNYFIFLGFVVFLGINLGMINTYILIVIQKQIPFEFLSRTVGILDSIAVLGSPIVLFSLQNFMSTITMQQVFATSFVVMIAVLVLWRRACRR